MASTRAITWASAVTACRRRTRRPPTTRPATTQNLMLTETAILNPKTVNETRFQFSRNYSETVGNLLPQINVTGAFTAGGANEGNNFTHAPALRTAELHFAFARHPHVPLRRARAPRKRARHVAQRLRRHVLLRWRRGAGAGRQQQHRARCERQSPDRAHHRDRPVRAHAAPAEAGLFARQIFARCGGGASQFNISAGNPYASIYQYDVGPVRAGRLARAPQPHPELRAALRNADQHQRPRRFRSALRLRVGARQPPRTAGRRPSSAAASACSTNASAKT